MVCQFASYGGYEPAATGYRDIPTDMDDVNIRTVEDRGPRPTQHPIPRPTQRLSASSPSRGFNGRIEATQDEECYYEHPVTLSAMRVIRLGRFKNMIYRVTSPHSGFLGQFILKWDDSETEDYTPVHLGYARLYTFADKWASLGSEGSHALQVLQDTGGV